MSQRGTCTSDVAVKGGSSVADLKVAILLILRDFFPTPPSGCPPRYFTRSLLPSLSLLPTVQWVSNIRFGSVECFELLLCSNNSISELSNMESASHIWLLAHEIRLVQ